MTSFRAFQARVLLSPVSTSVDGRVSYYPENVKVLHLVVNHDAGTIRPHRVHVFTQLCWVRAMEVAKWPHFNEAWNYEGWNASRQEAECFALKSIALFEGDFYPSRPIWPSGSPCEEIWFSSMEPLRRGSTALRNRWVMNVSQRHFPIFGDHWEEEG